MKTLLKEPEGVTVKQLKAFLRNANPDAVVVFDGPNTFSFVREAELDALPPGFNNRPCVFVRGRTKS